MPVQKRMGVDSIADTRTSQVPMEVQFDPTPAQGGRKFIKYFHQSSNAKPPADTEHLR